MCRNEKRVCQIIQGGVPQLHDGQTAMISIYLFVFSQQVLRHNCVFSIVSKNQSS